MTPFRSQGAASLGLQAHAPDFRSFAAVADTFVGAKLLRVCLFAAAVCSFVCCRRLVRARAGKLAWGAYNSNACPAGSYVIIDVAQCKDAATITGRDWWDLGPSTGTSGSDPWLPRVAPLRSAYKEHNGREPAFTNFTSTTAGGRPFVET